jgi:hypothetical protein
MPSRRILDIHVRSRESEGRGTRYSFYCEFALDL